MTRYYGNGRRQSTVDRDKFVIRTYREVITELGSVSAHVSRAEIYRRVSEKVGLCGKTVANIINRVKQ